MNAKKWCNTLCGVDESHKQLDLALLILRLVLGFAFIYHGWSKVSAMDGAIAMFSSMGVGTTLTYIAAYTEFLGGLAMLLGIVTRFAGGMLAIFMVVAIYLVHLSKGYSMMNGGYEYQLLLLAGVIFVGLVGPGKYSLHEKFCKGK
jgi:putative oxidoreductase